MFFSFHYALLSTKTGGGQEVGHKLGFKIIRVVGQSRGGEEAGVSSGEEEGPVVLVGPDHEGNRVVGGTAEEGSVGRDRRHLGIRGEGKGLDGRSGLRESRKS